MQLSSKLALKTLSTHSRAPSTRRFQAVLECCESLAGLPVIEVGIATVLEVDAVPVKKQSAEIMPVEDRQLYYYSLATTNGTPDFHTRANFQLKLEKPA